MSGADQGPATGCPDGGTCHHGCQSRCFRVVTCGPLSGVFPGDTWPAEIVAQHEGPPQTPATDSERDEGLSGTDLVVLREMLAHRDHLGRYAALALLDEVTRLTALLAEQAATIERVRVLTLATASSMFYAGTNYPVSAVPVATVLESLHPQRTEGQG